MGVAVLLDKRTILIVTKLRLLPFLAVLDCARTLSTILRTLLRIRWRQGLQPVLGVSWTLLLLLHGVGDASCEAGAQMEAIHLHRSLAHSLRTLAGIRRCSTTARKSTSASSLKSQCVSHLPTWRTSTRKGAEPGPGCLARPIQRCQRTTPPHKKPDMRLNRKQKEEKMRSYENFVCNFSRMPP